MLGVRPPMAGPLPTDSIPFGPDILAHMPTALTCLCLATAYLPGQTLTALAAVPGLLNLHLGDARGLSTSALAALSAVSKLTNLHLSGCLTIDPAVLQHLPPLPSLAVIGLVATSSVLESGLAPLPSAMFSQWQPHPHCAACVPAAALQAHGPHRSRPRVEHGRHRQQLAWLQGLTGLRRLDIMQTPVTKKGLLHLTSRGALEFLDLSECAALRDASLAPLQHLTSLTELHLNYGYFLTTAALKHVLPLTRLEVLDFGHCEQLDDRDGDARPWWPVPGLPRLRCICLDNTKVQKGVQVLMSRGIALKRWGYS